MEHGTLDYQGWMERGEFLSAQIGKKIPVVVGKGVSVEAIRAVDGKEEVEWE